MEKQKNLREKRSKSFFWNYLFTYKPDDKRIIVEKTFGSGTTINLGTKGGIKLLYFIILTPIIIGVLYYLLFRY